MDRQLVFSSSDPLCGVQPSLCSLLWLQILFMVGRGYLRPDITYLRSDMPKPIRRLYEDCIKYNRDDRPLFPQVRLLISFLFHSPSFSSSLPFTDPGHPRLVTTITSHPHPYLIVSTFHTYSHFDFLLSLFYSFLCPSIDSDQHGFTVVTLQSYIYSQVLT